MVTTILELLGSALLILALALFLAPISTPAAVGAAGVSLILLSLLITRRSRARR